MSRTPPRRELRMCVSRISADDWSKCGEYESKNNSAGLCDSHFDIITAEHPWQPPKPRATPMGVGACPRCHGYVDRDPGMTEDSSVYAKCRNCSWETTIAHRSRRGVSA